MTPPAAGALFLSLTAHSWILLARFSSPSQRSRRTEVKICRFSVCNGGAPSSRSHTLCDDGSRPNIVLRPGSQAQSLVGECPEQNMCSPKLHQAAVVRCGQLEPEGRVLLPARQAWNGGRQAREELCVPNKVASRYHYTVWTMGAGRSNTAPSTPSLVW